MNAGGGLGALTELLLPGGCVSCGCWIPREEPRSLVCPRCRSRLRAAPWPRCPRCHHPRGSGRGESDDCLHCRSWPDALAAARWAHPLRDPASALVHGLKYDGWRELADFMAARMTPAAEALVARLEDGAGSFRGRPGASGLPREPGRPVVVVPVPTTAARIRSRGYNQAALLAERLARRLGLPVVHGLRRTAASSSQTALAPDARRENVRGAFAPADPVRGARVVIVDDVLTTGATAGEAAVALGAAGASAVGVVTFARALPDTAADRGAAA